MPTANSTTSNTDQQITVASSGQALFTNVFNHQSALDSLTTTIPAGWPVVWISYSTPIGTETVTASSSSLSSSSQDETVTQAGSGAAVAVTSAPITTTANSQATNPFTVSVEDQWGQLTQAGSVLVNLSGGEYAATSGGAPVTSVTIPSGSTSASAFWGDTVSGSRKITLKPALSTGLSGGSQTETVAAGAPDHLAVTAGRGTTQIAAAGTAEVADQYGNLANAGSSVVVSLSTSSSTGSFTDGAGRPLTQVTVPSGASVTFKYNDTTVGTPTITGTSTNWGSDSAQAVINGPPVQAAFITAPFTGSSQGTCHVFRIQLQDANGATSIAAGTTTVNFSNTSSTGVIETGCNNGNPISSFTFNRLGSTVSLYYTDTTAGNPTLCTILVGGSITDCQTETVT